MKRLCHLIILLTLFSLFPPPPIAAQTGLDLRVEAGFDGFYKTGHLWTPVRVTIANQGPGAELELRLKDEYYQTEVLYRYPLELPSQSRKQLTLNLPIRQQQLTLELVDHSGAPLLARPVELQALNDSAYLVGVVAGDPSLLNALGGLTTVSGERVAVAHLDLADLPADPQAWDALDLLVFNDVDTSPLTPEQQTALTHWVSSGGRLIIGGGPNAAQTISGLQSLLPFQEVRLETLPHPLTALANFVKTGLDDRGPYVAAVPPASTTGVTLSEGNLPLILSLKRGLGQVHYLALDLGLAPLDVLAGQRRFLPRLVGQFNPDRGHFSARANWYEMRTGLALIPDQTLPTPGSIATYLLIYVLAIGPVNFLILSRLKRREWAWFSLPLIILLFCGFGYFSGFRLRGGQPLVRQIAILQAEAGSPLAEVNSFIGIYSPARTNYALQLKPATMVEAFANDTAGANLDVTTTDQTVVKNLQADIGGMPAILTRSTASPPAITARLSYNRAEQRLQGSLINDTGQPIEQAYLIVEDRVLELGTLTPGETPVNGRLDRYYGYSNFYDVTNLPANAPETLELASRDITIRAALGLNTYSNNGLKLNGLYLTGWQRRSPLEVELVDRRSDQLAETLLLVGLPLAVQ